jgi:hypothetical protein
MTQTVRMREPGFYRRPARHPSFIGAVRREAARVADLSALVAAIVAAGGADVSVHLVRPGAPTHELWSVSWTQDGRRYDVEASGVRVALERAGRRSAAISAKSGGSAA